MSMTRRQSEAFAFIAQFVAEKGYSPSFEEIGAAMGLSSLATVSKHVNNLQRKGALKRDHNRSRSITVTGTCPTCGAKKRKFYGARGQTSTRGVSPEPEPKPDVVHRPQVTSPTNSGGIE